jgi:phage-related minor tail protein
MKSLVNPVANALSGGLSSFFGGASVGGGPGGAVSLAPSAFGNVFSSGRIMPFARGGVISQPTVFPMANGGMGLAGEAGPESIMPLGRTPSGKLGVYRADGGSSDAMSLEVHFHNAPAGMQVERKETSRTAKGGMRFDLWLKQQVQAAVKGDLAEGGEMTTAIAGRFGLNPAKGLA